MFHVISLSVNGDLKLRNLAVNPLAVASQIGMISEQVVDVAD